MAEADGDRAYKSDEHRPGGGAACAVSEAEPDATEPPAFYVAVSNHKKTNLGTTIRCAVAFGAQGLLVVGQSRFTCLGAHGSERHLRTEIFHTWKELGEAMGSRGFAVVGIVASGKNDVQSTSVTTRAFTGPAVFVVASRGSALSEEELAVCSSFIHVDVEPLLSSNGLALDARVSLSIVLHHFTSWAGYTPNSFKGAKYELDQVGAPGQVDEEERERLREVRRRNREGANVLDQGDRAGAVEAEGGGTEEGEEGEEERNGLFVAW